MSKDMDFQNQSTENLLEKTDLTEAREEEEENKTLYSEPSETTIQNNIQKRDILEKIRNQKRILLADLCELSGGGGRFQKIILLLLTIIFFFTGFFSNLRIYSFEKPTFLCPGYDSHSHLIWSKCSEEEVCKTYYPSNFRIDYFFDSLVSHFGLFCDKAELKEVIRNVVVCISSISSLFVGYISDFVGRQKCIYFGVFVAFMGFLLSYFSKDFTIIIIGNSLLTSYMHINVILIYMVCNELISDPLRSRAVGLLGFSLVIGQMGSHIFSFNKFLIRNYQSNKRHRLLSIYFI